MVRPKVADRAENGPRGACARMAGMPASSRLNRYAAFAGAISMTGVASIETMSE
jgi:hypothetical protein